MDVDTDVPMEDVADAGKHLDESADPTDVTHADNKSDAVSEALIAGRVQSIAAAIAHAQQQTSAFAHVIADVESCKEIAGQHTMIIAVGSGSTVDNLVRQYRKAADSAPLSTSACLLVPQWPKAKFNHHLKGMPVLSEYPAGTHAKYPTKLVYAPPVVVSAHASSIGGSSQLVMTLNGKVAGSSASIAVDSQASHNFLSEQWIQRTGVHVTPLAGEVTMASGEATQIVGTCSVRMVIGPWHDVVECFVIKMASRHDMLLGEAYLKTRNAVLSYSDRTICFTKGMRKTTLHVKDASDLQVTPANTELPVESLLLSALQVKRMIRKGQAIHAFQVLIKPSNQDSVLQSLEREGLVSESQLKELIGRYPKVFPDKDNLPDCPPLTEHAVHPIPEVPGARPVNRPLYRLSPRETEEVKRQVTELLRRGLIEPSCSPYGASVIFVPKPDGSLRMCVDWRALNKQTVKDSYPLPNITTLLDSLRGARVYSSLDLGQAYMQLRIKPEDVPKTAFKTPIGSYQFKVLAFGLCNAPSSFVRVMNNLLAPFLGKFVVCYIDDILIYSKTPEEHLKHLELVFKALEKHHLYCNIEKCKFNQPETKFLGFIVGRDEIRMDPAKVAAVKNWPVPKNIHELRSFLGLANYFRRFIHRFAEIALPLTALLRKNAVFDMTETHVAAFEALKDALVSAPCLAMPDFSTHGWEVVCDASQNSLGAVLLQNGHPIAFESKKLTQAERHWHAYEREALAVLYALKVWRCYLEGLKDFKLCTDHETLLNLERQQHLHGRQARWVEYLSRFNFTWEYRAGRFNVADPMSRLPDAVASVVTRSQSAAVPPTTADTTTKRKHTPVPAPPWSSVRKPRKASEQAKQQVTEWAKPTPVIRKAGRRGTPKKVRLMVPGEEEISKSGKDQSGKISDLQTSKTTEVAETWEHFRDLISPAVSEYVKTLHKSMRKHVKQKNGLWYKGHCVVVPDVGNLRQQIISAHHDTPDGGHFGVAKTYYNLCKGYWWPAMRHDVETYIRQCHACQTDKPTNLKSAGLLEPLPIPTRKWESIGMDFITQLPCTKSEHDAIFVVVDRLSKLVHFIPTTTDVSAADVAALLVKHVAKLHGLPSSIVSDRDTRFCSHFWQAVMQLWGVSTDMTTSFHPQGNAQTERMNRVLEEYLRHFVAPKQDNWDELLSLAEFAINNSYQESIGMTPFYMTYGYHPRVPTTADCVNVPAAVDYVQNIGQAVQDAKELLKKAQDRQKGVADATRRHVDLEVGQEVLLSTENIRLKSPGTHKLMPRYVGPFVIVARKGAVTYELQLPSSLKIHPVFHVSLLKPYHRNGSYQPPPLPLSVDETGPLYEVEAVLRYRPRKKRYLIQWKGFGKEHNTWEPAHMLNAEAVRSFWETATESDIER